MENNKYSQRIHSFLRKYTFILLLLSNLPLSVIYASYTTLGDNLHNFTSQDGLADNMIFCIHKDQKGFMWFGTNNGLSKYDGKSFYNHQIKSNFNVTVSKIEESTEGLLFLLSNDWITVFDCKKESVQPLTIKIKDRNCQFTDFALLNDSIILACDMQNFLKIKVSQRSIRPHTKIIGIHPFSLKANEVFVRFCLLPDKKDFYAVTNLGRVLLIGTGEMHIKKTLQLPICNKGIGISSMSYNNGNLWITSMVYGIFICDKSLQNVEHFVNSTTRNVLSHNDVYSVSYLSEGSYIAATWYGYTMIHSNIHGKDKWTSDIFQQMSSGMGKNIETRMISSYYDPAGILWIGTHGGGIIMADLRWNFYKRYEQGCDNETESVIADDKGRIYFSTYHLGIKRSAKPFNMQESVLELEPITLSGVSPTYLCSVKDDTGRLWFGNKDGNVVCYDPSRQSYSAFDLFSYLNVSVQSLFIDAKQRFWVGTSNGLYLVDKKFSFKKRIKLDGEYPNVLDIKEDKENNLWVATGVGVFILKEQKDSWKAIRCVSKQPANTAQCILVASDGNVYVGFKNGLGIIRNKTMHFSEFLTTANGLISNWINCITEGSEGDIWIGSNSGITRYDKKSMCYNYYISGSIRSVANINGILFWGGSKHILSFEPKKAVLAFESNYDNKVYITNLEVGGKRVNTGEKYDGQVILQRQISYTDKIKLNYTNRDFALSFSNCSYSYGMQKYEYRLWPYQKEWIICNDGEGVSYANLSAGKYTFEVRAIYPGKLDGEITTLQITILPHWSQTWIFKTTILLCLIAALILTFQKIRKQQRRRERMLCLEHDLDKANMLKEQEKNMSKEREQFFAQAAHELRTPLTLILAPLSELLLATDKNNASYTKLLYIRRNAESMEYLINQLLHVQKMKAGMLKMSISKTSVRDIIKRTTLSFEEFAVRQGIELSIIITDDIDIYVDVEKMESVIRNLLSNAFKYTPSGGTICVRAFRTLQDDLEYCCIQVSDTGKGIALEQQANIFESFTTGNHIPNQSTAVGIGLYIVKSTLELHHGFVRLDSEVGKGSSFTLFIPEGEKHFADENCKRIEPVTNMKESDIKDVVSDNMPVMLTSKRQKVRSLLIVEDNIDIRNYIVSLFSDKYSIHEACNGEEGILKAIQSLPDLVISDVMMPIKDGFEFCKELKSNNSTFHIPVIMLTARAEDSDIINATHIGIDDYLTKPFNAGVLKAKVENLLSQRDILKDFYSKTLNLKISSNVQESNSEDVFMQRVIHLIETNLTNETFNAKTLSELLNMSQPTLYRKIKSICHLSIIDVIRNVRISKAASLLLQKKYSVQEVCEMVGYNDYDTFRKQFIAQFKVAPSKYEHISEKE